MGLSSVAFCVRGFGPLIRWHFRHSAEFWGRTDWKMMQKNRRNLLFLHKHNETRGIDNLFSKGCHFWKLNHFLLHMPRNTYRRTSWISFLTSQWFPTALGNTVKNLFVLVSPSPSRSWPQKCCLVGAPSSQEWMNAAGAKAHHKIHTTHKLSMEKKSWCRTSSSHEGDEDDASRRFPYIRLLDIPNSRKEIPTQKLAINPKACEHE